MREQIDTLFSKEMDRKQFLVHMGAGLMAVIGVSGLIKALTRGNERVGGYGSSSYGGSREAR